MFVQNRAARRRAFSSFCEQLEQRIVFSTLTVMNANSAGPGSLRQAIFDSNFAGGGTIKFDSSLTGKTILLDSNGLFPGADINIVGPGATKLAISGAALDGNVIGVDSGNVSISGLTVTGGNSGSVAGGGIRNAANLTLTDCVITANHSDNHGGGIFNGGTGTLHIVRCQVTANSVDGAGGGIY